MSDETASSIAGVLLCGVVPVILAIGLVIYMLRQQRSR